MAHGLTFPLRRAHASCYGRRDAPLSRSHPALLPEAPAVRHPPRLAVWRRAWRWLQPDDVAWRGAAVAAAAMTLALLFSFAHELTAGAWTAITISVVVPLGIGLGVVSGSLVAVTNFWAGRMPRWALITITGCIIVLSTLVFGRRNSQVIAILVGSVLLPAMICGAGMWSVLRHRRHVLPRGRRALALGSIVTGAALLCTAVAWYNWPGPHVAPAYNAAFSSGTPVSSVTASNPSDPGPYRALQLAYGNGTDRYRPEYSAKVGLRTASVDASFLLPSWRGLTGWLRSLSTSRTSFNR